MFLGSLKFVTSPPGLGAPKRIVIDHGTRRIALTLAEGLTIGKTIYEKVDAASRDNRKFKTLIVDIDGHAEEMTALAAVDWVKHLCRLAIDSINNEDVIE